MITRSVMAVIYTTCSREDRFKSLIEEICTSGLVGDFCGLVDGSVLSTFRSRYVPAQWSR
jgi:hypothetical protein